MINVRKNIFETNSSSTHAMVISSETPKYLANHVHFGIGEFGWGHELLTTVEDKAAYLYTSICCIKNDIKKAQNQLIASLALDGITCDFEAPIFKHYDNSDYEWLDNGFVDHCGADQHCDWVNEMLNNSDALKDFLFNDNSYVVISDDNCDDEEYDWFQKKMNPPYEHTTYYKGN